MKITQWFSTQWFLTKWLIGAALCCFSLFFFACEETELTFDKAVSKLDSYSDRVAARDEIVSRGTMLATTTEADIKNALPNIEKYPLTVDPQEGANDVIVEIFSSTEKSGKAEPDNWLTLLAEDFNNRDIQLANGKTAKLRVRNIPSGEGYQYIASKKYLPDAFTPSNHYWIKMIEPYGVRMTPISETLVDNTAGIVMKEKVYKDLEQKYGNVDMKNLINAVIQGTITMGYTNPFSSSTGINLLVTVLSVFANGDESKMLTPEVESAFEAFQKGVPFVALTTLQMRDSVQNDGSLDAFVLEHQTYMRVKELSSGYVFIPFGIKHSNPLYAVGELSQDKTAVLKEFVKFTQTDTSLTTAKRYDFGKITNYTPDFKVPSGETLIKAQALWKEKKDSRPILAVFLSDVSGSMGTPDDQGNTPMEMLKKALLEGSDFINPNNYIGLACFNNEVTRLLEVKKFNQLHRAAFNTAISSLSPTGNTGMYDGILISLQMLVKAKQEVPEGKPMLFVLTDGETNHGFEFDEVNHVLKGLRIPIYTIGYNANIDELKRLANVNEAANLNADVQNISYVLGNLLNAEM
jgi:Ca-activated chloride channel family protein